jgi:ubiquinone/menaquinone biosynthesis C-methylase UbiE
MLSANRVGYLPIGIGVKLDALQAARRVMRAHNVQGYVVAADLKQLPFKSSIFDVVFSYSVLQHTHRQRVYSCVAEVQHRYCRSIAPDDQQCIH